ncbi:DUF4411 family protein [Eubacterium sp. MSJ-33]|uniref:DUF4411 family protein n=1 Tax=Eubacterium sp. MSJ-33 TaxID=2841528 RepID=UPI001C7755F7|nr:DUF4411 family protein [Eubacterium sp. MSJ-33]QWT52205.1 DUF4411 family protein [Eubacterium sp. MSJ-33]
MTKDKEVFLVDSNSFMTPFRFYYAFDLVPAYWTELEKHIHSGKVVVLDSVKEEINKGDDDLAKWIRDIDGLTVIPKVTAQTVSCYQEVIQYVASCGLYKESALHTWSERNIADPWLIASAKANDYIIVTEEKAASGLSKKTPNKGAKIPDVAGYFGVKTIDVFDMMRRLDITIT